MQRKSVAARNQQNVILCTIGSPLAFSQSVFEQLGATLLKVRSGEDLIRELSSMRPIGVFLLVTDLGQLPERGWLQELEHKILFEGLRVVLGVGTEASNLAQIFSSKAMGHAHLVKCLGLRDLVFFKDSLNELDMRSILARVRFAFGLAPQNPFESHFSMLLGHAEPLEIALPGRISVIEDDCHMVVESAIYLSVGARVKMRLMGTVGDPVDVAVQVLENLPSGLRFNFGNSIRVRLAPEYAPLIRKLVVEEDPQGVLNRPMRRALVVTRSVFLRQRLVAALSAGQVESRIPLVRRNIRGDLPPLKPQFLVIEPGTLAASTAQDARTELDEFLSLAGPQCTAVIVGRRPDWQIAPSLRVAVLPDDANLEESLAQLLNESGEDQARTKRERGIWFTRHSTHAKVMLVFRENARFLAEEGIVFESQHVYRMWGNLEVRGLESRAHMIGRVARTERVEDSFRNVVKLGPRESKGFSTFVASIGSNPLLQSTFKDALNLRLGSQSANPAQQLPADDSSAGARSGGQGRQVVAGKRALSLSVDQGEELGYLGGRSGRNKARGRTERSSILSTVLVILLILGFVGFAVYGAVYGFKETKVYGESFQKLFEVKGKPQRSP